MCNSRNRSERSRGRGHLVTSLLLHLLRCDDEVWARRLESAVIDLRMEVSDRGYTYYPTTPVTDKSPALCLLIGFYCVFLELIYYCSLRGIGFFPGWIR